MSSLRTRELQELDGPETSTATACRRYLSAALALLLAPLIATQVGAQNLINNGNFDSNTSGWTAGEGFISHDAAEGSTSGPGSMSVFGPSSDSSVRQCVTGIAGSTVYQFGADFRVASGGFLNFCRMAIDEHDTANCSGAPTNELPVAEQLLPSDSPTYTSVASSFTSLVDTASVRVNLDCNQNFGSHTIKWDDVFLLAEGVPSTRYTLLAGFGESLYHLPGANGLVADADDVILADPTSLVGSDPNYRGAYSYRAGAVPSAAGETGLPPSFNRIAFLEGTVDVAAGGILVASDLMRTGRRQGMGLRPWDGPVDDTYLMGDVLTFEAPFAATGDPYIDGVLIPKANALGATGLLFADLAGTRPPNSNFPGGLPVRVVLVGVAGVPGMPAGGNLRGAAPKSTTTGADLSVTKLTDVSGLQTPGTTVVYTLTVDNAGPGTAPGVVLRDRLPFEVSYIANDCGAAAPQDQLFTWNVGQLATGADASCQVTVEMLQNAPFDFHNAGIAFGDAWDPNLDDNISEAAVEVLDGALPGVEQLPNQTTGFQSDLDCGACQTGTQAIADTFKVDSSAKICGLTFYGGYTDDLPFADQLKIAIYDDNRVTPGIAGVPGDPVANLQGVMVRNASGARIANQFDEYRYGLGLLTGFEPVLERGRYWLVIVNDSSGSGGAGDWFWESGNADALERSLPGLAFNPGFDNGSPGWGPSNRQTEAAFELCLEEVETPIFADGFESGDTSAWSSSVP